MEGTQHFVFVHLWCRSHNAPFHDADALSLILWVDRPVTRNGHGRLYSTRNELQHPPQHRRQTSCGASDSKGSRERRRPALGKRMLMSISQATHLPASSRRRGLPCVVCFSAFTRGPWALRVCSRRAFDSTTPVNRPFALETASISCLQVVNRRKI